MRGEWSTGFQAVLLISQLSLILKGSELCNYEDLGLSSDSICYKTSRNERILINHTVREVAKLTAL